MNHISDSNKVFYLFQSLSIKRKFDVALGKLKVFIKALTLSNPSHVTPFCCPKTMLPNPSSFIVLSSLYCISPPVCSKLVLPSFIPSLLLSPVSSYKS